MNEFYEWLVVPVREIPQAINQQLLSIAAAEPAIAVEPGPSFWSGQLLVTPMYICVLPMSCWVGTPFEVRQTCYGRILAMWDQLRAIAVPRPTNTPVDTDAELAEIVEDAWSATMAAGEESLAHGLRLRDGRSEVFAAWIRRDSVADTILLMAVTAVQHHDACILRELGGRDESMHRRQAAWLTLSGCSMSRRRATLQVWRSLVGLCGTDNPVDDPATLADIVGLGPSGAVDRPMTSETARGLARQVENYRPATRQNVPRQQSWRRPSPQVTLGQAAAAERRANVAASIDWADAQHWTCPGTDSTPVRWEISQMSTEHLYQTIHWLVMNCLSLGMSVPEVRGANMPGVVAKRWLADQPVFRGLVQESIRRRMTYGEVVYQFLRSYLSGCSASPATEWANPEASHQIQTLQSILDLPVAAPDSRREFGKNNRRIEL